MHKIKCDKCHNTFAASEVKVLKKEGAMYWLCPACGHAYIIRA